MSDSIKTFIILSYSVLSIERLGKSLLISNFVPESKCLTILDVLLDEPVSPPANGYLISIKLFYLILSPLDDILSQFAIFDVIS